MSQPFLTAPSFQAAGTPFLVTATGVVTNLNADMLDGQHASAFVLTDGTQVMTGQLKIDTTSNESQVAFRSTGTDEGGYLTSSAAGQGAISGGAEYDGSVWKARHTAHSIADANNGGFGWYGDTGLTVGATITLRQTMALSSTGVLTLPLPDAAADDYVTVGSAAIAMVDVLGTTNLARYRSIQFSATAASSSLIQWLRARGSTGSEADVAASDRVGYVLAQGWKDGAYRTAGELVAFADSVATNIVGGRFTLRTTSAAGSLADTAHFTRDRGLELPAGVTSTLWVSSTTNPTTAAGGIYFGLSQDSVIYRSAVGTLTTSALVPDSVTSSGTISSTAAVAFTNPTNGDAVLGVSGTTPQVYVWSDTGHAGFDFRRFQGTATGNAASGFFRRTRGDRTSAADVVAGDLIGYFQYEGWRNGAYRLAAQHYAYVNNLGTSTTEGAFSWLLTSVAGSFSERMRLDPNDGLQVVAGLTNQAFHLSYASNPTTLAGGIAIGSSRDTYLYRTTTGRLLAGPDVHVETKLSVGITHQSSSVNGWFESTATGNIGLLSRAAAGQTQDLFVLRDSGNTNYVRGIVRDDSGNERVAIALRYHASQSTRSVFQILDSDNTENKLFLSAGSVTDDSIIFNLGTSVGTKWGQSSTAKQAWWGNTAVVRDTGWNVTNAFTQRRTFDTTTVTLQQLAEVVATLTETVMRDAYGLLGA